MTEPAFRVERREIAAPAELAARFDIVRVLPYGDRTLAHELLVPKEFAADPGPALPVAWATPGNGDPAPRAAPGEALEQPLSGFRWIDPERGAEVAAIAVGRTRLGRDVGLADWLGALAERLRCEILSADALDFGGTEAVDALVRHAPRAAPARIARRLVVRNLDGIVAVTLTAAEARYGSLAEPFAAVLSSFRFLLPQPVAFTEPYVWSESSGAMPLGFRRPAAWRGEEPRGVPWGRQVLELRLDEGDRPAALLRALALDRDLARDTGLGALADLALEGLAAAGWEELGPRARFAPLAPLDAPRGARTLGEVHEGRAFGAPAEARVLALDAGRTLYALAAVYAARRHDLLGWMAGKRALDVAWQTLNRPEETLLRPAPRPAPPEPPAPPPPASEPEVLEVDLRDGEEE